MKVRDIMTTDVATATPETTLEDVATMMRDEDTGAIPVLDNDELVGIITDRDIVIRCIAEGKDPVETTVEDVVTETLETIEPDSDLNEARDLMSRRQIRRLPVVEDGELIGMLSIGDLAVKSDANVGDTLENVSEGVKASGTNAKRAARTGNTRDAGNEGPVRQIESGRKANARAGREEGLRRQGGRGDQQQGGRGSSGRAEQQQGGRSSSGRGESQQTGRGSAGRNQNQGISNHPRSEEQRRQNKVVGKRSDAKVGSRRRAS
jgi:CBS domain-containing protein